MSRQGNNQRLRLIDAMVLISMTAVGLAMASGPYRGLDLETLIVVGGAEYRTWTSAKYFGALAFPCITPLTLALPVLGLCRSGRSRGTVLLRPGLGSCVAASVALVPCGLEYMPFYLGNAAWHLGPIEPWVVTGGKVGYAVLGFWGVLAVAGRWRAGPGWFDRLGIAVGAIWTAGAVGAAAVALRIRGGELVTSLHWFG